MNTNDDKIFPGSIKYVLVTDCMAIPLRQKPKKVPGGYLTKHGRRYVCKPALSVNRVRLIDNSYEDYYRGSCYVRP